MSKKKIWIINHYAQNMHLIKAVDIIDLLKTRLNVAMRQLFSVLVSEIILMRL